MEIIDKNLSDNNKIALINHYEDFPSNLRLEIRYWIDNWINECFLQKQRRKVRCHPLSTVTNSISEKYIEWVSENQKADIQEEYYKLQNHITFMEFNKKVKEEVNPFRKNLQRILHENSHNKSSCKELFDTLHTMVKRNYGLMNYDVISFILFRLLDYKFQAMAVYMNVMCDCRPVDDSEWNYELNYFNLLLKWIRDLGCRMKSESGLVLNYINDISIGIYLFLTDLDLDPEEYDSMFLLYYKSFDSILHKKIVELKNNHSDLMVSLEMIKDKDGFTDYFTKHGIRKIKSLEKTTNISEENRETLIFGDKIIPDTMSITNFVNEVSMITKSFILEYLSHTSLGITDITFLLSDSSKMYLKETEGIEMVEVMNQKIHKTVAKYQNESGSALFVLFEPVNIQTETIYGLSLDYEHDTRGLLIIEKEKSDYIQYKFLYGGEK